MKDVMQNIDHRQLERFMRIPGFAQSLSPKQYSNVRYRMTTGPWSQNERIVYDAVAEGYTSLDSLPVATGLPSRDIGNALSGLSRRGYVKQTGVGTFASKAIS